MLKIITATALVAMLSLGATGVASAAPISRQDGARVAAPVALQNVHWEWRHHHRVWVQDHHGHYRHYGS